jgi:lysophospholipid acyltransferase (LPLAT)-like uncharacterized protein
MMRKRATRALRALLGVLLGWLARLWLATLRVTVVVDPALEGAADRPWVLAFLHGRQWPLLAWKRRRKTVVMVSLSDDGQIQSRALGVLGLDVVRGSSSRGGARGLAGIVRCLKGREHDAAFAVDGPRGPYGVPKPGVIMAARAAGAVIVPMGSAMGAGKRFVRAWDRFELAWPFARVAVVLGAPIELDFADDRDVARVADALEVANGSAEAILAGTSAHMLHFAHLDAIQGVRSPPSGSAE